MLPPTAARKQTRKQAVTYRVGRWLDNASDVLTAGVGHLGAHFLRLEQDRDVVACFDSGSSMFVGASRVNEVDIIPVLHFLLQFFTADHLGATVRVMRISSD